MKVLDLFSGIGGFSIGLERAGMETIAFCEIDPFCRKVLRKHWPEVPIHDDIRELDGRKYRGTVDVICGGYPCQPFSQAGKRKGAADDRHLWPEMFRVIKQCRPSWVIAENVAGHIRMGLDEVLFDLESEGYTTRTLVIPACAVDAHHQRNRVWIIANTNCNELREQSRRRCGKERESSLQPSIDGNPQHVANTQCGKCESRHECTGRKTRDESYQCCEGSASLANAQQSRGWQKWPAEPGVGRVANGVPRRVDRIKALGNAVVPQIPEMIGRAIINTLNEQDK